MWQAAIDCSFKGELHAHFLSVAHALHASDLKLALTIVFKHMQGSLKRYRAHKHLFLFCFFSALAALSLTGPVQVSVQAPDLIKLATRGA
jgi:hypothetical protein